MKSIRKHFPGVYREADRHGRARWRYRAKGVSAQIPGQFGSVEWVAAYEAIASGEVTKSKQAAPKNTVQWLIGEYLASRKFTDLAESTKKTTRGRLDWLRVQCEGFDYRTLKAPHLAAVCDKKDGPAAANRVKKDFSMLYNFAASQGWIDHNPARHIGKKAESKDGHYTWTDADIEKFMKRHPAGSKARFAMSLMLCTGLSISDLRVAGWSNVQAGRFNYSRTKTDGMTDVRIFGELAAELAIQPKQHLVFITNEYGRPFASPKATANWFKKRCKEAELPDRAAAHGLRKAGARRAAEAGANEFQIMSILGHSSTTEALTYVKAANRKKFADAAVDAVEAQKFSEPS